MRIATINPATNKVIKRFREVSVRTVQGYLTGAKQEFEIWKVSHITTRSKHMMEVAKTLKTDKGNYAALISLEMGKPLREAEAEIEKCALVCEYFAEHAKDFLSDEDVKTEATHSSIMYEPLGIILGIMPWNFPFWQVFRFAVPALMSGNVVLLKHAPNVPQCALAIQDIFRKANFPKGCFQSVLVKERRTRRIIEHPDVKMISLTGSDAAGSAVASLAGKHIKKTVMELGGNDAFIVLEDANLKAAAENGVLSRMMNAGQSCIAAKRFIVAENVKDQFVELLKELISKINLGNPEEPLTDMGPLAREDLARKVIKQIKNSVAHGAKIVMGGGRPRRPGAFVSPTLLADVKPGMPAFDEEIFGPVLSIIAFKNEEEAIQLANQSVYGLGASIWSEDIDKANRLGKQLNCGSVFINSMVKSDPRLPFGGINRSGYGRELSYHGLREFVNIKTVWVS